MRNIRTRPWGICSWRQPNSVICGRRRVIWLAQRFVVVALAIFVISTLTAAQSQPEPAKQQASQPQALPAQPSPSASQAQPKRILRPTVVDAARDAQARVAESAPQRVFTNDDTAELPLGDISIVGNLPLPPGAGNSKLQPVNDTAQQAAYWKARFAAARQRLVQDKKALPVLQSQLETERVLEEPGDPDSGQLFSDVHVDLVQQINTLKITIENDKKALTDLHEEFRRAGGQPGWIR